MKSSCNGVKVSMSALLLTLIGFCVYLWKTNDLGLIFKFVLGYTIASSALLFLFVRFGNHDEE